MPSSSYKLLCGTTSSLSGGHTATPRVASPVRPVLPHVDPHAVLSLAKPSAVLANNPLYLRRQRILCVARCAHELVSLSSPPGISTYDFCSWRLAPDSVAPSLPPARNNMSSIASSSPQYAGRLMLYEISSSPVVSCASGSQASCASSCASLPQSCAKAACVTSLHRVSRATNSWVSLCALFVRHVVTSSVVRVSGAPLCGLSLLSGSSVTFSGRVASSHLASCASTSGMSLCA